VQSASNTASQIFYFPNIGINSTYSVTVTFSGSAGVASGCVAVEYMGADIYYPLDSVSAGYGTAGNQTPLMDSGAVAPANSNLLVFGGGTSDAGTANPGTGFTTVQKSGSSITEQMIVTGNSTLQRATVCLGPVHRAFRQPTATG
jgi:hypothetical protein